MGSRRLRGDAGASTTEFVILTPALILAIMMIVQAGLYYHAVSVASAAAQDGARAASLQGATTTEGEAAARDLVDTLAPDLLSGVTVQGQLVDGGEVVRMSVRGEVSEVFSFPGAPFDLSVTETAEQVRERFRPRGEFPDRN
jgi:Flp pilus assembly protein TadG